MSKKWRCRRHCCHSIVAGTTAVVPARFVSHLRVANRLWRLCPLGTRFPTVPAGVIGRNRAPNPCAAALFPQTSLRVRSTEDEDSPKGYHSPKPATLRGAGRKALFAGNGGQLWVFRQTETPPSPVFQGKAAFFILSPPPRSPNCFYFSGCKFPPTPRSLLPAPEPFPSNG